MTQYVDSFFDSSAYCWDQFNILSILQDGAGSKYQKNIIYK